MLSVERAIEVFGTGFSFTRSFTHPYEFVRVGPLWVMRDLPRRSGPYRNQELIAYGVSPDEAVRAIRKYAPEKYALCVIHDSDRDREPAKREYKARGFRALHHESFMVCSLDELPAFAGPCPVHRVLDAGQAEAVAKAARSRQILTEHLQPDAPLRLYAATDGDNVVGWVRSIQRIPEATWVSNMVVLPEYRRRGIARSIMSAMLADDRKYGARYSVLLASTSGSQLYPVLGYQHIGVLQVYVPAKGRSVAKPDNAA